MAWEEAQGLPAFGLAPGRARPARWRLGSAMTARRDPLTPQLTLPESRHSSKHSAALGLIELRIHSNLPTPVQRKRGVVSVAEKRPSWIPLKIWFF